MPELLSDARTLVRLVTVSNRKIKGPFMYLTMLFIRMTIFVTCLKSTVRYVDRPRVCRRASPSSTVVISMILFLGRNSAASSLKNGRIVAIIFFLQKSRIVFIHALCFISNVYKQRFLGLVKFLKKLSNRTSLF